MAIINNQTYLMISSSLVPVRDKNGSLLSITSSEIPINDQSQFVELSSSYYYQTTESLKNIINIEFTELTANSNLSTGEIPAGQLLISQSDYDYLLERILNLENDIISSESLFNTELDIAKSENTALVTTVESVKDIALDITNDLLEKYQSNEEVSNDLGALKYIWFIPFNDILTGTTELVNRKTFYVDASMSLENNIPTTIHETIVSYSLDFNGNYLQQVFENYDNTNTQLLNAKIAELHSITSSLRQEIEQLKLELQNCQGGSEPTSSFGKIRLVINGQLQPDEIKLLALDIITSDPNNLSYNKYGINVFKYSQNNIFDKLYSQPPANTTIRFNKTFLTTEIKALRVTVGSEIKREYDVNNINNLTVPILEKNTTKVEIILNNSKY